jgi:hypothetical protein
MEKSLALEEMELVPAVDPCEGMNELTGKTEKEQSATPSHFS